MSNTIPKFEDATPLSESELSQFSIADDIPKFSDATPLSEDELSQFETRDEAGVIPTMTTNFAQGASFGLSDEVAGGVEALGDVFGFENVGTDVTNIQSKEDERPWHSKERLLEAYRRGRDTERVGIEQSSADRPKLAMASDLAGGFAAPLPGGSLIKGGKAATGLVKGGEKVAEAGLKQAGMSAAKTGALAGGLEGFGRTDSEDPLEQFMNTIGGAGGGAVLGKVVDKIGAKNSQKALGEFIEEAPLDANRSALNAIGATASDFAKELGTKTSTRATEKTARGTGSTLLDEGVIKARQTAGQLKEDLVNKLEDVYTNRMVPTVKKLDDVSRDIPAAKMSEPLNGFNNGLRNTMESMTGGSTYAEEASGKIFGNMMSTAQKMHADVLDALRSPNKFDALNEIKRKLQKEVDWDNPTGSNYNEFLIAAQGNVSTLMNDLAAKVSPELGEQMVKNNKTYANLLGANRIAGTNLAKSQKSNNKIGFGEYFASGAISNVTDNKLLGPLSIAGKRVAEKYGGKDLSRLMATHSALGKQKAINKAKENLANLPDSPFKMAMQGQSPNVAAAATNSAAAILDDKNSTEPYKKDRQAADFVKNASAEEIMKHAEQIRKSHGESGERLAGTLEKIAARDKNSRNALIFSVLQNPANRQMLGLIDNKE